MTRDGAVWLRKKQLQEYEFGLLDVNPSILELCKIFFLFR